MPNLSSVQALAIAAIASLIIGFSSGWLVNGWRLHSSVSDLKTQQATLQATTETARAASIGQARKTEIDHAIAVGNISSGLHHAQVKHAKFESDRDIAIATGTQRVYVRADCPSNNGVPESTAATAGANAASAELDSTYRQTLSDLRRGVEQSNDQITGLQEYAKQCALLCRQAN